jgi:hypothetical protein
MLGKMAAVTHDLLFGVQNTELVFIFTFEETKGSSSDK